jgi:hypothetical protein
MRDEIRECRDGARPTERRLVERNKVSTAVYLAAPGEGSIRCRATNLTTAGVFLQVDAKGLPVGTEVGLVFAVDLGNLVRLHRRKAIVAHVAKRGAGLMMQGRSRVTATL